MEDYDQQILQDGPLRVLQIFPKRNNSTLHLNINTFRRMYGALICPLCERLLKTPVYLKCSHRFCKDCIEKFIRNNIKKSCPNCKGQLSTKRELRTDTTTQNIIKYAFKDPRVFSASFQQAQQPLLRSRSGIDFRKNDNYSNQQSQSEVVVPMIKRTRTEGEQSSAPAKARKKRAPSEKKLQSKILIEADKQSSTIQKRVSKKQEEKETKKIQISKPSVIKFETIPHVQVPSIQIFRQEYISKQRIKKKKIPIIDLASESEEVQQNEIQQIRKQEFIVGEDKNICSIGQIKQNPNKNVEPVITFKEFVTQGNYQINKQHEKNEALIPSIVSNTNNSPEKSKQIQKKSISGIFQNSQMVEQKVIEPYQELKLIEPKQGNKQDQYSMMAEPEVIVPEQPEIPYQNLNASESALKAIQVLKTKFKEDYPKKIIELSSFSFYTQIVIDKISDAFLVPDDVKGTFLLSLKANISLVASMIGQMLNIEKEFVVLYTKKDDQLIELSPNLKLYEVNSQYWNTWKGIQLLDLSELIDHEARTLSKQIQVQSGLSFTNPRELFYSVNIDKLLT